MNARNRHLRAAYEAFCEDYATLDNLLGMADHACSGLVPLHGSLFELPLRPEKLRDYLSQGRRKARGFRVSGCQPLKIELPAPVGARLPHPGPATAFIICNAADHTACLVGLPIDFEYLWAELSRYAHTCITVLYLGTQDFKRSLLGLLREKMVQGISVRGFTANVLWEDGQRVKVRREWFPDAKPVAEFFVELEEDRQWLRSIELTVRQRDSESRGRIRRDLTFSCQGTFSLFWRTALQAVKSMASANRETFQDRSVSTSPTRAARPLQIAYPSAVFDDKSQNHRLIRVLRKLPDCGLSVFHLNPLLHASLVDYVDGSTYSIWVTDSAAVKIIPGLKASAGSLGRLCNHINEHFEEGSIEDIPS